MCTYAAKRPTRKKSTTAKYSSATTSTANRTALARKAPARAMGTIANELKRESAPMLAVSTWFGLVHIGALSLFSSLAMVPIALAGALRARAVLFAVLVVALLYFAVVDFLRVGRLAAYVHIALGPDASLRVVAPESS